MITYKWEPYRRLPAGQWNDPKTPPGFNERVLAKFEDAPVDVVRYTSAFEYKKGNLTVRPIGWMEIPK